MARGEYSFFEIVIRDMGARADFYRGRLSVLPRVYASTSTSGRWWNPLRTLGMSQYTPSSLKATSDECTGDEDIPPTHPQMLGLKTPTFNGQKHWTQMRLLNYFLSAPPRSA